MSGFADGLGEARKAMVAYFGFDAPEQRSGGAANRGDLLDDIGDTVHGAELPVLDRDPRAASRTAGEPEPDGSGRPSVLAAIESDTEALGFTMSCEEPVGRLLRLLAAAKPGGRVLELGTGTGAGTAWLLAGMDEQTTLDTVDNDPDCLAVARRHHGGDPRVRVHEADGGQWLADRVGGPGYDLVFADTWPGKFTHRDEVLSLVRRGGFYVVDDLARQPADMVPEDHHLAVEALVEDLESRAGWEVLPLLGWSCGVLVLVRK